MLWIFDGSCLVISRPALIYLTHSVRLMLREEDSADYVLGASLLYIIASLPIIPLIIYTPISFLCCTFKYEEAPCIFVYQSELSSQLDLKKSISDDCFWFYIQPVKDFVLGNAFIEMVLLLWNNVTHHVSTCFVLFLSSLHIIILHHCMWFLLTLHLTHPPLWPDKQPSAVNFQIISLSVPSLLHETWNEYGKFHVWLQHTLNILMRCYDDDSYLITIITRCQVLIKFLAHVMVTECASSSFYSPSFLTRVVAKN